MKALCTFTLFFFAFFCSANLIEAEPGSRIGSSPQPGNRENPSQRKPPSPTDSGLLRQQPTNIPRPTVSPQQQVNLQKLQADLTSLKSQSQVTAEQKQKLAADLRTLAEGTVKPSLASVNQLATDLSAATANSSISKAEQAKLMQDISAVLNSANISPQELQAIIADVQSILIASGVNKGDIQGIIADLQAIGRELQENAGAAKESKSSFQEQLQRRSLPARRQ